MKCPRPMLNNKYGIRLSHGYVSHLFSWLRNSRLLIMQFPSVIWKQQSIVWQNFRFWRHFLFFSKCCTKILTQKLEICLVETVRITGIVHLGIEQSIKVEPVLSGRLSKSWNFFPLLKCNWNRYEAVTINWVSSGYFYCLFQAEPLK